MSLTNEDLIAISQLLDNNLDARLKPVENKLDVISSDLQIVKHKVTCIELTIENELQTNIMRVAEGHIDLSRNMSEIKASMELMNGKLEISDLFIRHHDSEIKKLKVL